MLLDPLYISETCVAGTFSVTTLRYAAGFIKQLVLKAANTDTTFDVRITDKDNVDILDTRLEMASTGTFNRQLEIPVLGKYTITVLNSSNLTETFTGKLMVQDKG